MACGCSGRITGLGGFGQEPATQPAIPGADQLMLAEAECRTRGGTWDVDKKQCTLPGEKKGWWAGLSDNERYAVIGGAALLVGGLLYALMSSGRSTPNPPRRRYRSNLVGPELRLGPTGLPIIRGKRWGRKSAPAKYRRLGAVRRGDYAYPQAFMYPVVFRTRGRVDPIKSRKHVASAKGYFTKHKHRYPMAIRRTIARNINKAARRFGLAPDVRP